MEKALLTSSLFMISRELPSYLSTAYSLRFKDFDKQENVFKRTFEVVSRLFQLVKELVTYKPTQDSFERNVKKLNVDFGKINELLAESEKPICAYFVSSKDHNRAIISDHLYYYHHYKIQKFQKHFDVSAKVVRSTKEMFDQLRQLKGEYPNRDIKSDCKRIHRSVCTLGNFSSFFTPPSFQ